MFGRLLDRAVDWAMVVAEVAITLMMLHITVEIGARLFFRIGLEGVNETVAFYYMIGLVFLSLAFVTRADGHIAAQIFTDRLPARAREVLEGIVSLALAAFMALLVWQSAREAYTMTLAGEVYQSGNVFLLKWPPRWALSIGAALMALYALLVGIRKLRGGLPAATPAKSGPAAHE
jgi:TRAP-type C4-dicarboxylate transport system permease small subunit